MSHLEPISQGWSARMADGLSERVETMTNTEARRLGKYHHGQATKVVSIRIPADMAEAVKEMADNRCESVSQYMERLIETQALRKR